MNHVHLVRRTVKVVTAVGAMILGLAVFTPSAFALIARPVGDGTSTVAPTTGRHAAKLGMAGWEIALIAVAAAVFTATLAVLVDRALRSTRKVRVSAT